MPFCALKILEYFISKFLNYMVWIREVWRVRKIEDLLDLLLKSKLKILDKT